MAEQKSILVVEGDKTVIARLRGLVTSNRREESAYFQGTRNMVWHEGRPTRITVDTSYEQLSSALDMVEQRTREIDAEVDATAPRLSMSEIDKIYKEMRVSGGAGAAIAEFRARLLDELAAKRNPA